MMPLLLILPALVSPEAVQGWTVTRTVTFKEENLYGHIDGGAELFLETGFETLEVRTFSRDKVELTLETYRMKDAEAALATYLSKCGKETPLKAVSVRHTASPQQVTALKGRCMVVLNHPTGKDSDLPELAKVLNEAMKAIPDEKPADLFALLPKEGRVAGTELLARGPLGLQNVFTFGDGDALSQGQRVWAVGADYKDAKGRVTTKLVLTYPDATASMAALVALGKNLDSTLKAIRQDAGSLRFQDSENRYSLVRRDGARLCIDLRLADMPQD